MSGLEIRNEPPNIGNGNRPNPLSSSSSSTSTTLTTATSSTSSATDAAASSTLATSSAAADSQQTTTATTSAFNTINASSDSTQSTSVSSVVPLPVAPISPQLESPTANSYNGPSSGTIATAVVLPVLVLILIAAAVLIYKRRRRRASGFNPAMTERSHDRTIVTPTLMGVNTTYYTGLDTDSGRETSGEYYAPGRSDTSSFAEPPPPYKAKTHNPTTETTEDVVEGAPLVRLPTGMPQNPPSPDSWATAPRGTAFLTSSSSESRSASQAGTRSINSDLYSDDASVRSARAARLSVGGAAMISQLNVADDHHNPFEDPTSPVSSVDGDDHGSVCVPSRAVSPVSR